MKQDYIAIRVSNRWRNSPIRRIYFEIRWWQAKLLVNTGVQLAGTRDERKGFETGCASSRLQNKKTPDSPSPVRDKKKISLLSGFAGLNARNNGGPGQRQANYGQDTRYANKDACKLFWSPIGSRILRSGQLERYTCFIFTSSKHSILHSSRYCAEVEAAELRKRRRPAQTEEASSTPTEEGDLISTLR